MFNLGSVFALLTRNILFWCKMKWSWSHTDAIKTKEQTKTKGKVNAYISTFRETGNNKNKLKQVYVLTKLKWAHKMTISAINTFCVRCSTQFWERLEPIFFILHRMLYQSINTLFGLCCVVYVSLIKIYETAKAKFIFYAKENGSWTWKSRRRVG